MIPSDRLIRMSAAVINHGDPKMFGVSGVEEQAAWDVLVAEYRGAAARGVTLVMPSEYFQDYSDRGGNIVKYSDEQPRDELGRFSTSAGSDTVSPTEADTKIWQTGLAKLDEYNRRAGYGHVYAPNNDLNDQMARMEMKSMVAETITERLTAEGITGEQLATAILETTEGQTTLFDVEDAMAQQPASTGDGYDVWNVVGVNAQGQLDVQDATNAIDLSQLENIDHPTPEEIQGALEEHNSDPLNPQWALAGTPEADAMIREAAVTQLVNQWAQTSNDGNLLSLSLQEIAADRFGIENHAPWHNGGFISPDAIDKVVDQHGEVLGSFLQAQYDATQDYLKENEIKSLTLYRGMVMDNWEYKDLISETKTIDFESRPLSSWTSEKMTAYKFAEEGQIYQQVLFKATIPADRIFSMPMTGVGCLNEKEIVVLGGTDPVEALSKGAAINAKDF